MSKLINPNDYLKLSSYHEKYGVCKRKLYRHVDDEDIDYVMIDSIPFIKDTQYLNLKIDQRTKKGSKNVKNLTKETTNVKTLTKEINYSTDNEEVSNVQSLTKDNVKTLTKETTNVQNLTMKMYEIKLLEKLKNDENSCTISDHDKIKEIKKKYSLTDSTSL